MTDPEISLREFIEQLLTERQRADNSRWQAHEQVHVQEEIARNLAIRDMNRRLEDMNQFRTQINTERGEYVNKESYALKHDELNKKVDQLLIAKSNMEGRLWMLGAALTGFTVVLNFALKWLLK